MDLCVPVMESMDYSASLQDNGERTLDPPVRSQLPFELVVDKRRMKGVKRKISEIFSDSSNDPSHESSSDEDDERGLIIFRLTGKTLNPFIVKTELITALQRRDIKIEARRGTLSVRYINGKEKAILSKISTLDSQKVHVAGPRKEDNTQVVITGVPLSIGVEEVNRHAGSIRAHRIVKKLAGTTSPTTAVILTFPKNRAPPKVSLEYLTFKCKPFIKEPVRCYRCHNYGHVAKHCTRSTRCPVCAGEHPPNECTRKEEGLKKCTSCGGDDHFTGQKVCPKRVMAATINKHMATDGLSYADALKRTKGQKVAQPVPKVPGTKSVEPTASKVVQAAGTEEPTLTLQPQQVATSQNGPQMNVVKKKKKKVKKAKRQVPEGEKTNPTEEPAQPVEEEEKSIGVNALIKILTKIVKVFIDRFGNGDTHRGVDITNHVTLIVSEVLVGEENIMGVLPLVKSSFNHG